MKNQDLLASKKREDKLVKFFPLVSSIGIITCVVFCILYLIFQNSVFETVAILGLIVFALPPVSLQFFMSAGIYPMGLGMAYFLFYLLLFPFVDMLFFIGINVLFHIIPIHYYLTYTDPIARAESTRITFLYIGSIYLLVNGAGLLWRIRKNITRNKVSVLLSL